jgi:uncharacterized protein YxjI
VHTNSSPNPFISYFQPLEPLAMAALLAPLPAPVAVDTNYIAKRTEKLTVTREPMSADWVVTLEDGTTLFTLEREHFSLSHRKTFRDSQGCTMYQIRKQPFTMGAKYYAEMSENGPRLWEYEIHSSLGGSNTKMAFRNTATGGKPDHLDFKHKSLGSTSYVKHEGRDVAVVHKKKWQLKRVYELTIAQGLDMTLIIGMILSMDDKVRSNAAASAGAAGGSGAC